MVFDNALGIATIACAVLASTCWLLSFFTREYSWVDRIWSLAPVLYVGWFGAAVRFADPRLTVMALLVAAWGARLTFNFWRKGGYRKGGEDYRWGVLRGRMSPTQFEAFNVLFIAGYQNVLILLFTLPAWTVQRLAADAAATGAVPWNALDTVATALFVLFLVGETIADQQQWSFHQDKASLQRSGVVMKEPFLTTGLFRFSRHPNFFCEQAIWWSFYLFAVAAGAGLWHPTILGAVLLTLLFHGSTTFTEAITASKYPAYADYQRRTSRLIPWLPGPRDA